MIRPAIIAGLLATPVDADERAAYWAALEDARTVFTEKSGAIYDTVGSTTYDADSLVPDGTVTRYGEDGSVIEFTPELVAIYFSAFDQCRWGPQTNIYPALPTTAAQKVRDHAINAGWPSDASLVWETRQGGGTARSLLAVTIGGLDYVDALTFGDMTVYLGLTKSEGTS